VIVCSFAVGRQNVGTNIQLIQKNFFEMSP
jgi:hypothetical protein